MWLILRDHLLDKDNNATAKPLAWAWISLVVAVLFFVEFLRKLDDPFYQRHPENYFVFWVFIGLGVLTFVFGRLSHITVSHDKVVEHTSPFWRKEIPVAELRRIDDDGGAFVLRSRDHRKINVLKAYSGAAGVVEALKRLRPDLFES